MRPIRFLSSAVVMIALLLAGFPIGYVFIHGAAPITATSTDDILKGRTALAIEESYEESIFFRKASIATFNSLAYWAFAEARSGALVGADGWLFSREEFERPNDADANVERSIAYIEDVADRLSARDIRLVVALLPMKADLYSENLGRYHLPPAQSALYDEVRKQLSARGDIVLPDLRTALTAEKAKGPVFLKTDTHWTVEGASSVAEAVARAIPADVEFPAAKYTLTPSPGVSHDGDLKHFMDFGPFADSLPIAAETILPVTAVSADGDIADFFGAEDGSDEPMVALVGTSYSANALWSFEAALKSRMATDIVNRASEGLGPFKPMQAYLDGDRNAAAHKQVLIIWEVPVRYLIMDGMLPN